MKPLKVFLTSWLALSAVLFITAHAQEKPNTSQVSTVNNMADGEIRKIDKDAKKITIKHGEIKNLDMPKMTMVFQVQDHAILDKVKVGDKVKFFAEKLGGAMVVTDLQIQAPQ